MNLQSENGARISICGFISQKSMLIGFSGLTSYSRGVKRLWAWLNFSFLDTM